MKVPPADYNVVRQVVIDMLITALFYFGLLVLVALAAYLAITA